MNRRIVIVDDHPLIRMAVRMVLERDGHEVVAECRTGVDGVQAVRALKPDLVILDLVIPDLDGFSVMDRLRGAELGASILVLTSGDTRNYAMRCLQAGASGFVCKDDGLDEISKAVKALLAGYSYFPQVVTNMLRENLQEISATESMGLAAELDGLTDREMTVLGLLVKGMNNQEIGRTLMLSHKTVSTYKVRLMSKLNAPNMVELVKVAQRNGIATS
ncbi:response regulator transcription factor [Burkholderia aenigmatica]|uniref:response regulator transcription factor n=1 Tax=Burkholderia TaxID=32008 RepID=UPI00197BC375|nr:response regulator transcription factor [Burkholderia aenigmatica]MBN3842373.1 response regulator transcription factor [Burkholderia sp. Ac-20349]MDN7874848.1 response regulator transcription factor [Burkholderia aenigmatica]